MIFSHHNVSLAAFFEYPGILASLKPDNCPRNFKRKRKWRKEKTREKRESGEKKRESGHDVGNGRGALT